MAVTAENLGKAGHFCDIAHLGGGAVRLHKTHIGGSVFHLLESLGDGVLLAFRIGRGDALSLAVAGRADGADQRVNLVAVAQRVGKAFEYQHARAFSHYKTVGPGVEHKGAFSRQRAYLAEFDIGGG